ncbi:hypothetical protein QW131_23425 [Roseibium salinum]|nr:hypothetical protein [Roseibium salinum]
MKANLGNAEFLDEALKNLTHTVDPENGQVSVSSSASLENYFLDIGGFGKEAMGPEAFTFGTSAQATFFSRYDVELAMVLDVTGSMASHVESLKKKAAWSALNILIPKDTSEAESKVRISMIPYSEGVNLGEFANKVAQGAQGTQNCVTERLGAAQFTDDPYDYDSENEKLLFWWRFEGLRSLTAAGTLDGQAEQDRCRYRQADDERRHRGADRHRLGMVHPISEMGRSLAEGQRAGFLRR